MPANRDTRHTPSGSFMRYTDPSLRRLKHGRIRPMTEDLTLLQRLFRWG
jgi:hypothetical protein